MMKWQGKVEDYDFYRENREKIVTFNHIKKTQGEQAAQKYAEESGLDEEWNIWKVKKAEREAELNKAIDEKLDNPDGEME
jgi:low affinity Fe/Cu permease